MPAEVYSATKPAVPYRAWLIASFLLVLASALAGDMAQRGAGTWTAGSLIQPQEWEMAFRPPAQFEEIDPDPQQFGNTYVFQHRGRNGRFVELTFWRLRSDEASAMQAARAILEKSKSWFTRLLGPTPIKTAGRLGDRDALEVLDTAIPMVLRILVWENGWAFAVSVRVEGGTIDEGLYALFDMTCRSVRFRKPDA